VGEVGGGGDWCWGWVCCVVLGFGGCMGECGRGGGEGEGGVVGGGGGGGGGEGWGWGGGGGWSLQYMTYLELRPGPQSVTVQKLSVTTWPHC